MEAESGKWCRTCCRLVISNNVLEKGTRDLLGNDCWADLLKLINVPLIYDLFALTQRLSDCWHVTWLFRRLHSDSALWWKTGPRRSLKNCARLALFTRTYELLVIKAQGVCVCVCVCEWSECVDLKGNFKPAWALLCFGFFLHFQGNGALRGPESLGIC